MDIISPEGLNDEDRVNQLADLLRGKLSQQSHGGLRIEFEWHVEATGEGEYYTLLCSGQLLDVNGHDGSCKANVLLEQKSLSLKRLDGSSFIGFLLYTHGAGDEIPFRDELEAEVGDYTDLDKSRFFLRPLEWQPALVEIPLAEVGTLSVSRIIEQHE